MTTIPIHHPIRGKMNQCASALHQHAFELRQALDRMDRSLGDASNPDWPEVHKAVAGIRYHATGMSRDAQTSWAYKDALKALEEAQ